MTTIMSRRAVVVAFFLASLLSTAAPSPPGTSDASYHHSTGTTEPRFAATDVSAPGKQTITPASSTGVSDAEVDDRTVEAAMTPSTPRKLNSLPAYVAKPSILQAYPSRLGEDGVGETIMVTEVEEEEKEPQVAASDLGDKQELRFGNNHGWHGAGGGGGKKCQQYLLQVRNELHCTSAPYFEQIQTSFDARLRDYGISAKAQHQRLDAIESSLRGFQNSIDSIGRYFNIDDGGGVSELKAASGDNDGDALVLLSTMSAKLGERLRTMQRERAILLESNANLSARLEESEQRARSLDADNAALRENATRQNEQLAAAKSSVLKLTSMKNKMMKKIIQLRNCRLCTANNRSRLKQCQRETKKQSASRRQCQQRLLNITSNLAMLTQEITRLKENQEEDEEGREGNQADMPPCRDTNDQAENDTAANNTNQKQKQCGRLLRIGDPVLISEIDLHRPGKKCGVWMRDTMIPARGSQPGPNSDKIWSLNIPGRQACASSFNQKRLTSVKRRREPILTLYQYANENEFCLHRPERRIQLPKHKQMESTGAVIYNGSLFYQRRNSRRIIKFDIEKRKLVAEIPLKNAGFHGMFAYQWGGYSDVDLAVDEFGLWVIYSSTDHAGNIIVAQLNPDNLETLRVVYTTKRKSEVANSFIVCGVLYTVSSYNRVNGTINYAYNLLTNRVEDSGNISFKNAYRYNTMIDYNPVDRQIYAWDNGRRVVYPVSLRPDDDKWTGQEDDGDGPGEEGDEETGTTLAPTRPDRDHVTTTAT